MHCEIGQIVDIPGLGKRVRVEGYYDYKNASTRCPNCKDDAAGVPWGGWFSCDYACSLVALIETGECFMPVSALTEALRK